MANSLYQWLIVGIVSIMHPFYVSVIELNHSAKDKSLETSVRIFSEDLEATLTKFGNTKVDLSKPSDKAALDRLIENYIHQKIGLKVDGRPIVLYYLGYEQKQESTWLYFETGNIATLKKVEVVCNLLYDFQDKQANIFNVKYNGGQKSYKLDYPKTAATFEF